MKIDRSKMLWQQLALILFLYWIMAFCFFGTEAIIGIICNVFLENPPLNSSKFTPYVILGSLYVAGILGLLWYTFRLTTNKDFKWFLGQLGAYIIATSLMLIYVDLQWILRAEITKILAYIAIHALLFLVISVLVNYSFFRTYYAE
ncbi:MAG: hypothetical protein MK212_17115 [Saprospiraceae bacterium]|nr:hypothetical protein [Saprospiraceae bacterium]